ncbi:metalloregulator ArsR/SmtB family transcription factor [Bacillus sp. AK128]
MKPLAVEDLSKQTLFSKYEKQFKALADQKRLQILNILTEKGSVCVCDMTEFIEMPQSKLSYHLKILLDANMIHKKTEGTWSYYSLNQEEVSHLLSEELCCLFRSADNTCCDSNESALHGMASEKDENCC